MKGSHVAVAPEIQLDSCGPQQHSARMGRDRRRPPASPHASAAGE
jgi:hypothetical protein